MAIQGLPSAINAIVLSLLIQAASISDVTCRSSHQPSAREIPARFWPLEPFMD